MVNGNGLVNGTVGAHESLRMADSSGLAKETVVQRTMAITVGCSHPFMDPVTEACSRHHHISLSAARLKLEWTTW
jgi:hypothetical protein